MSLEVTPEVVALSLRFAQAFLIASDLVALTSLPFLDLMVKGDMSPLGAGVSSFNSSSEDEGLSA